MGAADCPAGIIAELNPFHSGPEYLISEARRAGASPLAVVMSGDCVQRGAPARLSTWDRTEMALRGGADAVFELPLPWAMAGAERFALGGVFLLSQLGCRRICFGSENGSAAALGQAARLLLSPAFSEQVRQELSRGVAFASAREAAVRKIAGEDMAALLQSPNNILGVEYLKAALTLGVSLEPFTAARRGAQHHDAEASSGYASATALRGMIRRGEDWTPFVPEPAAAVLRRALADGSCPAELFRMERAVLARLRTMSLPELAALPDVSEGLENRLFSAVRKACSLDELFSLLKTKRYPLARLRRIVFSAFVGLTAADAQGLPPYLRLLGLKESGVFFLREAKRTGNIPVVSHSSELLHLDKKGRNMIELEGKGSDLHALFLPRPTPCGRNLTNGVIRLGS